MKLYRIRDKETGKYFLTIRWYDGKPAWGTNGSFFRTTDAITNHLRYLCSEQSLIMERCGSYYMQRPMAGKFDKKKMKLYQIIISDVTVNKSKRIDAADFWKGKLS